MPMLLAPNNARAASFQWVLRTSYPAFARLRNVYETAACGAFFSVYNSPQCGRI
jgi:hypothetical protein